MQFAVGAGWYEDEYKAHGYRFPDMKTRRQQFVESLKIMVPLVRGDRVDFDGDFFSAHTDCFPKPSGHVNVIIGAKKPRIVKIAANYADEWNTFGPTKEPYSELKREADSVRPDLKKSMTGACIIAENKAELLEAGRRWMRRRGLDEDPSVYLNKLKEHGVIIGTTADFPSELKGRMDWGIEKFYFQVDDPTDRKMFDILTSTLKTM